MYIIIGGLMSNIYDLSVTKRDGSTQSLKDFEGKVLLIVNTATGCEELYEKYHDKGLEILD